MTTPPKAGITLGELRRIVLRLANQGWVRYWVHWNYPVESPWLMAIQVRDAHGWDVSIRDLATWDIVDVRGPGMGRQVYVIERRDEGGTPFRSPLTGTVLSDPDPHGPAAGPGEWEANR
jgi:hypothetical protein